jgi:protocatechuate 3,4-dioxygenase beta subunit
MNDAAGIYAGVVDTAGQFDTSGRKFLRGYQITDASGVVRFVTIYPGWYTGRTVHLHFKVRLDPSEPAALELTSQLYFDDALTDEVAVQLPYAARGVRTTRNMQDAIYRAGGSDLMLDVQHDGARYVSRFDLGLAVA